MRVLPYLFFLPRRQNLNKEGILNMATKVSRTKIVTSGKLNSATRQSIERYWKKFEEDGDHLSHTIEYDSKKDETTITMLPCVVLEEESYSVSGRSNQPTESYSRHIVIDGEMPTITGTDPSKTFPMLPPTEVAKIIIAGIEKNKLQIYTGRDSKLMNLLYRLNPVYATNLIAKQMKSLLSK